MAAAHGARRSVGCFGLTEPDFGSNPGGMRATARRAGPDWVLDGTKMWITNGSIADLAIVWAQTEEGIRGFIVPTVAKGFSATEIRAKALAARLGYQRAGAARLPRTRRMRCCRKRAA